MRILHVIPSVSTVHGGPSVVIRTMTEALAHAGHDVHLATTDDDGSDRMTVALGESHNEEGVSCWYFARSTRFYRTSRTLTIWLMRNIGRFDVVHIHALFSYSAIPAAIAACRARVPYVIRPLGVLNRWGVENRRPRLKKLSYLFIEGPITARASLMHYTSSQERLEAENLGVATPSVIIPNAVAFPGEVADEDVRSFCKRYAIPRDKPVILFLSRFDQKKGLDLLLRAFALLSLKHLEAVLVLAGAGDNALESRLRDQAQALGLDETKVIWTGFLTGSSRWAAYKAASIFTLPSYSENFGVAVVEAMASGVPVVITDQVGIHPDVSKSGSGIVTPCDPMALSDAMSKLIGDPALRRQMGHAGRQFAAANYSVAAMTRGLEAAYMEIVPQGT